MIHPLLKYFSSISSLSLEEENAIMASLDILEKRKGEYLLKAGKSAQYSYFITKGLIRQFIIKDGEEITLNIFTENQWIISLDNEGNNKKSPYNMICEEDCVFVLGNEEKAKELFDIFPRFEAISRKVMEKVFAEMQVNSNLFKISSAEERYLFLLKNNPDIFQRLQQYHIASFLGIKPESLSRIRKRIMLS